MNTIKYFEVFQIPVKEKKMKAMWTCFKDAPNSYYTPLTHFNTFIVCIQT